ncbi:MAG TPA: PEGA domain-containing protein, partial [Spirochaetia bacterium]|nr:PEGA domain-containing protein [Spirochaetia bacterium]
MKKIASFVSVVAFLALASCATTKGSLFQQVISSSPPSQGSSSVEVQPSDTNPVQTGLEVQTNPSDAQVYLNDLFIGDTPINYTNFQAGSYKITISKLGYYDNVRWLNLDPKAYTIIQTDLTPKTGYLLVTTNPIAAEVLIDGQQSQPGAHEVPVGHHVVTVRAFGFDDWTRSVDVQENQTIQLNAELAKATFRINNLSLSRQVLNPLNPGL